MAEADRRQAVEDLDLIRNAIIEVMGGIEFKSHSQNGRYVVFVKKEIGAAEREALPVNLITATLKSYGLLEKLLRDLHSMKDLPNAAFQSPGAYGGKATPGDAVEMEKSFVRQLQDVADAEIFERRELEIRVKERALVSREMAVTEQEKLVEAQFKSLMEVKEDEKIDMADTFRG